MTPRAQVSADEMQPKYEIAEVFRRWWTDYRLSHWVSGEQLRAAEAILRCRTAALGGHVLRCDKCGYEEHAYNSCKNRNCPQCGSYEKMVWLERMRVKLLPLDYYHGVFTTDHLMNPLLTDNAKAIYDLLFATTWQVLVEFGRKYLGGEMGVTMVLHTWSQTMTQHVHTHCIITGGALVTEETGPGEKSLVWRFFLVAVTLTIGGILGICGGTVGTADLHIRHYLIKL